MVARMKNPIKRWFSPHPIFWPLLLGVLAWVPIIFIGRWIFGLIF